MNDFSSSSSGKNVAHVSTMGAGGNVFFSESFFYSAFIDRVSYASFLTDQRGRLDDEAAAECDLWLNPVRAGRLKSNLLQTRVTCALPKSRFFCCCCSSFPTMTKFYHEKRVSLRVVRRRRVRNCSRKAAAVQTVHLVADQLLHLTAEERQQLVQGTECAGTFKGVLGFENVSFSIFTSLEICKISDKRHLLYN